MLASLALREAHTLQRSPVDEAVALAAAPLHVPDPMPTLDRLIAATALVHDLTLVTRNRRDMERTGVSILSPWDE